MCVYVGVVEGGHKAPHKLLEHVVPTVSIENEDARIKMDTTVVTVSTENYIPAKTF